MQSKRIIVAGVSVLAAVFLSACEVALPIQEMVNAKLAITKATEYKAEKYAPDELAAAEKLLLDSHDQVKNGKEKDAKKSADDAKAKAEEALAKALPLLAADTIKEAKDILAGAKGLYSAEFAPEKTTEAENCVAEADTAFTANEFVPAYEKALLAIESATAARDAVLAMVPSMEALLAEKENARDELIAANAVEYAGSEMTALDNDLSTAKSALEAKELIKARDAIDSASSRIKTIQFMGEGANAQAKIARAEEALSKASESPQASQLQPSFDEIGSVIAEATGFLANGDPAQAGGKADEALAKVDALMIELAKLEDAANVAPQTDATSADTTSDTTVPVPDTSTTTISDTETPENLPDYVVQWRKINTDCLWRIAQKVYKNARLWPLIYMANRTQIKDPDLIYPGQKLKIPAVPPKKKAEETKPASTVESIGEGTNPADTNIDVPPPVSSDTAQPVENSGGM